MPRVRRPQEVRWRPLAVGCATVFLTLPLVLLLWRLLRPDITAAPRSGAIISPMLDPEQRMRLTTYRRECRSRGDCEPPLGCLYESRYKQAYCTDSQCMTDAQCPEAQECRALATYENGPQVRICVPIGIRQEGQGCDPAPEDKQHACAAGLMCGGDNESWCGRPCRLGSQGSDCSEGFFCTDTVPAPMCLPTCEARGCPEGQSCVRFDEGASVCAQVYGSNCQQSPCPEGRRCIAFGEAAHPGKVWTVCIERCSKDSPLCSTGKVCDVYHCIPACDPQAPSSCGDGYRCGQASPAAPFGCLPDW
jgi:hypothetical protein